MRFRLFIVLLVILNIMGSVSARTRNDSIHNFLDDTRVSQDGFAEIDESISITSSTYALQIGNMVGYEVNNTVRILNYYQRSQNPDFGFGQNPDDPSNWKSTIDATNGILYLDVNATKLQKFNITGYINDTASTLLFITQTIENSTIQVPRNLTISIMNYWFEYLSIGFILGYQVTFPVLFLIDQLSAYQELNGTFTDFDEAVYSTRLLTTMGLVPNDIDLASKFIRAYATTSGLFSNSLLGPHSIKDTYLAIMTLNSIGRIYELDYRTEIIKRILSQQESNSGFMEFNSAKVTLEATFYAIKILQMLNAMDELLRPDVLQTHGFINYNIFPMIISISFLVLTIRKRKETPRRYQNE